MQGAAKSLCVVLVYKAAPSLCIALKVTGFLSQPAAPVLALLVEFVV